MSNYNSLKTTIDANIKQNGVQAITGQILNSVLNAMVNTLGAGYQFAGVATLDPATDPGTPDAKVFYIANGKGTYANFGGLEVTEDDVVVLYWDSSWHKVSTGIASMDVIYDSLSISKNLLVSEDVEKNVFGVEVTFSKGILVGAGTCIQDGGRLDNLTDLIPLDAGTYTLSRTIVQGDIIDVFVENSSNSILAVINKNTAASKSFTLSAPTEVYIGCNFKSGNAYSFEYKMQLEKGSVATPFIPVGKLIDIKDIVEVNGESVTAIDKVMRNYAGNLRDFELTWETGKFISRLTGALVNSTEYKASNRLDISGYSQIIVSAITSNDLSGYAFYDENGAFVSGGQLSVLSGFDVAITTINVPDGANYFAFTTYINSIGEVYVRMGERLTDILDSFKASLPLDAISQKVLPTHETPVVEPYTEKAYISSGQGVIMPMTSNVYSIASPVYLNKGDVLKGIWGIGANVAGLAIADHADATKFEVVLTDASTSASPREYTATKDCYAFISFYVSNGLTEVKVIKVGQVDQNTSRIELLENRVSSIEESVGVPYQMALMRPICIGDSLTSGASYDEGWGELVPIGSSIDENYPRYLGKMMNCEVKNAGVSGYSASDWWKKFINNEQLNLTQYDSAFIWLGTNYGCASMPTDAEIESFVPDPSAVASTSNQSLYLIEIIKKLKEAHEDMFIVIMTCFASKSVAATNNQVVRQIAAKYGCHVIDNSDLSPEEHPELHCNINNPHFGKAGNIFIANRCCKDVQKILTENPLLCEFGYTARQN